MKVIGAITLAAVIAIVGCGRSGLDYCPPELTCVPQDASGLDIAEVTDMFATEDLVNMNATGDLMMTMMADMTSTPGTTDLLISPDLRLPDMAAIPETCADVLAADPSATDGTYTLYVARNLRKPWTAHCRDMRGRTPKEYIPLMMVGLRFNFSQYTAGGASPGTDVRTSYSRIRIDPKTLLVDVSDQTFSASSGQLTNSGGPVVTSMSYAAAMDCAPQGWGVPTGVGNIDLRGTPFAVRPGIFGQGPPSAGKWCGGVTYSDRDQVVDIKGGGWCGWWAAGPANYGQSGSPFNGEGGFQLQLDYL